MWIAIRIVTFILVIQLAALSILTACSSDSEDETVIVTIGHLSDMTGPTAAVMKVMNMALEDMVKYYNEEKLIPGIELKVITYDGQYDPSKDIPGYEWLRQKGADLIFTGCPGTPVTLKSRVDQDKCSLFTTTADLDVLRPPGYVFALCSIPQYEAYTLLGWIADNDWDYETKGPARIGGASWAGAYSAHFFDAMREYAEVHPEQFEWVGGYLTPGGTMSWGPEVVALQDCDYVNPCPVMAMFVREYREAGGKAKIIGSTAQASFLGLIDDARLWDEIDQTIFIIPSLWWNQEGEVINLARQLVYENHSNEADSIVRSGTGYLAVFQIYQMLQIIQKAAKDAGPENFNSQSLYDAAISYSQIVDGFECFSFSETKRDSVDYFAVYEARASGEDLFRVDPEWHPVVYDP